MDGDTMQVYLANESMEAQSYQVVFYVKKYGMRDSYIQVAGVRSLRWMKR